MYRLTQVISILSIVCGLFGDFGGATPFTRKEGGLRISLKSSSPISRSSDGGGVEKRVRAPDFTWGQEPMRGVNIGGWLVLEPWITPSVFEGKPDWVVDEWTYGAYMSSQPDPMSEVRHHWNTWFQYYELENIAAVGLNTIRVQIGFWSLIPLINGEPFLIGAFEYLKLAVTWAQGLNLKVMLDLHGAPGGQNGFDNSGLRSTRQWFWNQTNLERTLDALRVLTEEFTSPTYGDTIVAIEYLNEPFPQAKWEVDFLRLFYQRAYTTVRNAAKHPDVVVALDAAFQDLTAWDGFMTEPGWSKVAMDTHVYAMFNLDTLSMGYTANLQWYCSQADALRKSDQQHWTIVGEFTPANTDCAKWLNGRGAGARYDNTLTWSTPLKFKGDCGVKTGPDGSRFGADYTEHLAKSFETQTWVYEQASGWIMWTWKTEQAADWSMATGITYGWIPTPITAKPHGTPCNFSTSHALPSPPSDSGTTTMIFTTSSWTIIALLGVIWLIVDIACG